MRTSQNKHVLSPASLSSTGTKTGQRRGSTLCPEDLPRRAPYTEDAPQILQGLIT